MAASALFHSFGAARGGRCSGRAARGEPHPLSVGLGWAGVDRGDWSDNGCSSGESRLCSHVAAADARRGEPPPRWGGGPIRALTGRRRSPRPSHHGRPKRRKRVAVVPRSGQVEGQAGACAKDGHQRHASLPPPPPPPPPAAVSVLFGDVAARCRGAEIFLPTQFRKCRSGGMSTSQA